MPNLLLGAFLLALTCLASADASRQSFTVKDEINAANSVFMVLSRVLCRALKAQD